MTNDNDIVTITLLTCGHVDDGKSTLIGRMLYDIGAVPDDQVLAARDAEGTLDYSLFTDGLEDERRQGITIDVAYRYLRHNGRRYQIADTPGHLQYMRNMAVAAVASDVAVILVDAVHGIRLQTVEYSKIARFFGVRQFLIAINKMDAVEYSEQRFNDIKSDYLDAFGDTDGCTLHFIPVSALAGDNVVTSGDQTPWYQGETLLRYLELADRHTHTNNSLRLPIQTVVKDDAGKRWYLGTLHGDALNVGDRLYVIDNQLHVTVDGITHSGTSVSSAARREAIAVSIEEDVDITRGSVLSKVGQAAAPAESFNANILWLDKSLEQTKDFQGLIKIHHHEEQAHVTIDAHSEEHSALRKGFVTLARPIAMDRYDEHPHTGLFLLIDIYSERIVGVGTVTHLTPYQDVSSIAI